MKPARYRNSHVPAKHPARQPLARSPGSELAGRVATDGLRKCETGSRGRKEILLRYKVTCACCGDRFESCRKQTSERPQYCRDCGPKVEAERLMFTYSGIGTRCLKN